MNRSKKEIHLDCVDQLLKNLTDAVKNDCIAMLNSGMVDINEYSVNNYQLAKILVDAAIERNSQMFARHGEPSAKRNLVKM